MTKITKFLLIGLLVLAAFPALAQEDLEVGKQRILPGTPFYFLKRIRRRMQEFFTFNPVGKLNLKQKFSSEKLAEVEQLIKEGEDQEIIKKALANYKKEEDEIRERVQNLKQSAEENPKIRFFMEKYEHQVQVHSRVLEKLEENVPPEVREKIREQREEHLERFKDVMLKLEEEENLPERFQRFLENASTTKNQNASTTQNQAENQIRVLEEVQNRIRNENAKEQLERVKERVQERIREEGNGEEGTQGLEEPPAGPPQEVPGGPSEKTSGENEEESGSQNEAQGAQEGKPEEMPGPGNLPPTPAEE